MKTFPNIVLDARWITPEPSGIAVYTLELMRRLPAIEPEWRWHFLFRDETLMRNAERDCAFPSSLKTRWHLLPCGPLSIKSQFAMPRFLRSIGCDLFHSTSFMVPYFAFGGPKTLAGRAKPQDRGCGRCIATIHDAIPLILPDYAPRSTTSRMRWLYRDCLRFAVRCSAFTITGSNASRRDIASALDLSQNEAASFRTIYDGVSGRFSPAGSATPQSPDAAKVVLYVGRLDPYKNVPALVDAFAMLRHETGMALHLAILGPDDPRYPEARLHTLNRGIKEHVSFIHGASNDALLAAYRSASLFVNPSRYEGFGLPMIEAMRCGIPVVCADGGSQPEIAGGAAEIVPAGDVNALAAAMKRVLLDDELRSGLVAKGLRRGAEFSWEETARQTAALYREALGY